MKRLCDPWVLFPGRLLFAMRNAPGRFAVCLTNAPAQGRGTTFTPTAMRSEVLHYRGRNRLPAWCFLLWDEEVKLAIVTEHKDNSGASITNAAEAVAEAICELKRVRPEELILVEHYGPESYHGQQNPHEFTRVEFRSLHPFSGPQWKHITKKDHLFQFCLNNVTRSK